MMSFLHSPFDKERVRDVLSRWYNKIEHNNERTLDDYVDKYYQQEDNNKWFYSLVKHIDDKIRLSWIDRFKYHDIDEEAKINVKDELGISEIYNTDYRLNGGIALSRPLFIVKDYDSLNKSYSLSYLGLNEFKTLMETFNLGKYYKDGKLKDVSGRMVYKSGKNKTLLMKKGYKFYSEDPQVFSIFSGYDYDIVNEVEDSRVQMWLNHIKEVLANNDEIVYNYIIK